MIFSLSFRQQHTTETSLLTGQMTRCIERKSSQVQGRG